MIQEIIVAIIGLAVLAIVAKRIVLFFFGKSENKKYCGCSDCHYSPLQK